METEERPSKMRKLEHPEEENDHSTAPPNATVETLTDVLNQNSENPAASNEAPTEEAAAPKISKNQLKKQRRLEQWEAGREDRKIKRKEKAKERKERKREAWKTQAADEEGNVPPMPPARLPRHSTGDGTQVPITVIFDCDFEDFMYDHELKSLGLQITRCYSDNRKSKYRAHLALASFGGKMKERFDGILAKQYTSWKGFQFFEEDFVEVAKKSKEWMSGPQGGQVAGALERPTPEDVNADQAQADDTQGEGEIIYLSSESDNVLTHLKPNGTYIIGGLVDKNRHKGICHKRAVQRGIKTAKLPIKEYLEMRDRQVLVTNHVLEILLKWMEFDDWGKAFMEVMPKRKGGKLRDNDESATPEARGQDDEDMADAAKDAQADAEDDNKAPTEIPETEVIETTKGLPGGDTQTD